MIYVWKNFNELEVLTDIVPHKRKEESLKRGINKTMDSHQEPTTTPRKKGKRFRSAFTTEQVNYLENEFKKYPYIGHVQRKEVAAILNIPEKAVKVWFQNRRMREKNLYKDQDFFDDCNSYRNMTFGNDQLINVHDVPSVSDQSLYVLPITTYRDRTDNINNMNNAPIYKEDKQINETSNKYLYNEMSPKRNKSPVDKVDYKGSSPVLKPNIPSSHESSAEFSIDLCKKYRTDLIRRYGQEKCSALETQTSQKTQSVEQDVVVKAELKCNPENEPEDLSHKSSCRHRLENPPQSTSRSNVGLQPVYVANYAQPYLPAANMMWNPVNILPVLPSGASAIPSSSNRSETLTNTQEQNEPKKQCNCDCHVNTSPAQSSEVTNQSQQPQYIITAVPFPNYPKF